MLSVVHSVLRTFKIRRQFGKMQTHVGTVKKFGHIRRPSYGKATPISSLLLDLSNSSSIRHDGVSPESSERSHVFSFGPHGPILQHHQNRMGNVTINFIEQEKFAERNDKVEPESKQINATDLASTFEKCLNYHHHDTANEVNNVDPIVARDTDDIDKYLPNGRDKPCLICNVSARQTNNDEVANVVNQPMKELCDALCNDKCKSSTAAASNPMEAAITNDTSGKSLVRSNSSRQEFLASMLQEATTLVEAPKPLAVNDKIAEHTAAIVAVDNSKEISDKIRDKLDVADALANTSMLTTPTAKRRLAARQMEMNLNSADFVYDSENADYIPPKELLMYLVR